MFSFTVSFRKNAFSGINDIFPDIEIFPLTLFRLPTNICRKELLPEFFLPSKIKRSPGSTTIYSVTWMLKSELE
jgi:hypothetical protein